MALQPLVIRPEDGHIFERIPIVDLAHLQVIVDAFNQRCAFFEALTLVLADTNP